MKIIKEPASSGKRLQKQLLLQPLAWKWAYGLRLWKVGIDLQWTWLASLNLSGNTNWWVGLWKYAGTRKPEFKGEIGVWSRDEREPPTVSTEGITRKWKNKTQTQKKPGIQSTSWWVDFSFRAHQLGTDYYQTLLLLGIDYQLHQAMEMLDFLPWTYNGCCVLQVLALLLSSVTTPQSSPLWTPCRWRVPDLGAPGTAFPAGNFLSWFTVELTGNFWGRQKGETQQ